ncbi:MAG: M13 family metallopeptidase [Verrucomicrobiales bacterium]|nr:M13 family metallopeptidase [Verrucomicrobiales bacterium]
MLRHVTLVRSILALPLVAFSTATSPAHGATEHVPRFSTSYMDPSVSPRTNFFTYANGSWVKANPVPDDKSRWASFDELQQRNWHLIKAILEEAAIAPSIPDQDPKSNSRRLVGDFFASAMDTNRIEQLKLRPIQEDLDRLDAIQGPDDAARLIGDWHRRGIASCFGISVYPDAKNSDVYALYLSQGGLGLPDRDYYLAEGFAKQRDEYRKHIASQFQLLGEARSDADALAASVIDIETELAKASRTRTELRDQEKNYHRRTFQELKDATPDIAWDAYFAGAGITPPSSLVVRQPEFFQALSRLGTEREPEHWLAYLRWHLLRNSAPYLHAAAADESFRFYGTVLQGQPKPEPRWQRAAKVIDGTVGEALGQIFVQRHFPPEARARMAELVQNIQAVFRDRLGKLDWMSPATRAEALKKFDRFRAKIGHPETFRDYSSVAIRRDDFLGNIHRADAFEFRRDAERIGKPVDKSEWHMTPQTVNAYFNPTQNEIVFPAGILQPPFFDLTLDDAVNYGAIGSVIGHEITHGYDDQGRKYDAAGNLHDWWAEADAKEFTARAEKLVSQYESYEPVPGAKVNGRLTLGENIADLGGSSIAFEALQRALAKDPSKRKNIDGLTPEQRFFLAFAQAWRVNTREAEIRRRLVVDPHSPPQFRAFAPLINLDPFHAAFGIQPGDPMWKAPENRARIW